MANTLSNWPSPFLKQCFVTAGVAINLSQFGIVAAYVVVILPQLNLPGADIVMDEETASWFASIQGLTLIIGTVMIAHLMGKYGRWVTNVCSAGLMFTGWVLIVVADSVACLMLGRFLKGISLGLIIALCPVIIGECASPRYRGSFLASTTALLSIGTAFVHFISFLLHWRTVALLCVVISFINLLISIYSPESPSWLATEGRYDECRKVFRWLRGPDEEEELQKMIQANMTEKTVEKESVLQAIKNRINIIKKKEVYKPVIIGIHLNILCYWCGLPAISSFPNEVIHSIVGIGHNTPAILITLDIQRLITNTSAMYVVKKVKRKNMLLTTISLNAALFFVIAGYVYAREQSLLPFDHPLIGVILLHIHMFSMAMGGLPLPTIISGEIYPLKYRSFCSSVTTTISSINLFLAYKTFIQTEQKLKIFGAYSIYGLIVIYCLSVTYHYLPETKDKTLLDIENEFRGAPAKSKDVAAEVLIRSDGGSEI
ncbi:facilitated trehalose transporter Tret1-like [Plodia interpunctella]|uniref:facilitated trehalose transporter Tret1-like n=1 Tax=Plodia interpunctella TaxID=58824 RepID=UPI0023683042|nr:facilitated trehalose transporter Tret1-like [Plodia interpunctella]